MAINFEEDSGKLNLSEDSLNELTQLAEEQIKVEHDIEEAEEFLKQLKAKHFKISEELIPAKMASFGAGGLAEFKLKNGRKISVKKYYSASISEDNKSAAFGWLDEHGHMDIIKREIAVPLGKGSTDVSDEVTAFLESKHISFTKEEKIHPMTLKAFVKEQVEAGSDLPLEVFKVYIGNKTVIK
jgi:hypothetical protein